MSRIHNSTRSQWAEQLSVHWPLAIGLLVLYLPTFYDLATGLWSSEAYAHAPIILGLASWLIIRKWPQMSCASENQIGSPAAWSVFIFALLLYIVGRSQAIMMFELGSLVLQIIALLLIVRGPVALRTQWFPLFFLLFVIPLPGAFVDAVTMPMKIAVSYTTEVLLYWAGLPIARQGVILQIGQYQLLVADACAGLQTLLTLEALGLFYLNAVSHSSAIRNIALSILIMPISFAANVIRVISITLITYYFGDEAAQGFLHGFAGMVLFLSALLLIVVSDSILQYVVRHNDARPKTSSKRLA